MMLNLRKSRKRGEGREKGEGRREAFGDAPASIFPA